MAKKTPFQLFLLILILSLSLSSCHLPWKAWVEIAITSHTENQAILLGEETHIISLARSSRAITSVELYIDGVLDQTATPEEEDQREFTVDQAWTPTEEGQVIVSVLAYDRKERPSEPFSLTLQVVTSLSDLGTPTPTATITPEGISQTQTAQAGCTNTAAFIEHVTIPLNTTVPAGSNFTKIWRVNNSGTCDWIAYELLFISGDMMSAGAPKALPLISAGSNADLTLDLTAPASAGIYSAAWRLRSSDGSLFGPELIVTIVVPQAPTLTPNPTATFTPTNTASVTPTVSPPVTVDQIGDQMSVPAGGTNNLTVTCPTDSVVVSGGFAGSSGVRIWHSTKDGNGWRVYATNTSGSAKPVNVYATCLVASGANSNIILKQETARANDFTRLEATCPAGSIVTGGAWVIGTNTDIQIYNSSGTGNGWQIYIDNSGASTPLINVYAVCLSGVSGSTSQQSNTSGTIPAGGNTGLAKDCPAGNLVTGGGFALNIPAYIYNTSKMGNGWQNYAQNDSGAAKSLYTYVVCYAP